MGVLKIDVLEGKIPLKMDDLGVPLFQETTLVFSFHVLPSNESKKKSFMYAKTWTHPHFILFNTCQRSNSFSINPSKPHSSMIRCFGCRPLPKSYWKLYNQAWVWILSYQNQHRFKVISPNVSSRPMSLCDAHWRLKHLKLCKIQWNRSGPNMGPLRSRTLRY